MVRGIGARRHGMVDTRGRAIAVPSWKHRVDWGKAAEPLAYGVSHVLAVAPPYVWTGVDSVRLVGIGGCDDIVGPRPTLAFGRPPRLEP